MSTQLNYVQYDFTQLVSQLQGILQTKSTWVDLYLSSTGETLIEFYGYAANMILYYVERTAEEVYISTAQRRSSILNLVALLNYRPYRNVSATGNVTFTLATTKAQNVFVPAKTQLQTTTGLLYSVSQDSVIFAGQLTTVASVIQGVWVTNSYTSIGGINQEYPISSTQVEDTNLVITVNGSSWSEVTSFTNSINTSNNYRVRYELDDTLTIVFGDNINGLAPSLNDVISISYLKSDGLSGNVYSSGSLTKLNSTIYDALGTTITDITVTNSSSILGGDDLEGTEDIRYNAPRTFSTGDRFVTIADGLAIVGNYPSVASVNVWGENEESAPNYSMYNQVKISMILQNWTLASTDFKSTLGTYLKTKAMLGVRFSYYDPTIVQAWPIVTVKVKAGYSLSAVQASVLSVLQTQFLLGTTAKIGTNVRWLAVNQAIAAIDGVSYGYITLQGYKAMTYHMSSAHDYGAILDLLPVKAGTVNIYHSGVLAAVDTGTGYIVPIDSSHHGNGTINYTTGQVVLDFTPDYVNTDPVTIQYQQNASGDLVVTKNQILQYINSTITVSYA